MAIFDNFFARKKAVSKNPDNTELIGLLEKYGQNPSQENYQNVVAEIMAGNAFLILPSVNDGEPKDNWTTLKEGATLQLTSVFDLDGLKVLGAFTSPEKLIAWTKEESGYTAMKSQHVIDFCQNYGIDRIVIDTDTPTMFVLERNRENIQTETIQEETQVTVGAPIKPISGNLLKKLQSNFAKVSTIKEVYHYAMVRNDESILMLGFVLDSYSDNSKTACIGAIQNAVEGEQLELPLEMFMLKDEAWLQTVKDIENSLIYKK